MLKPDRTWTELMPYPDSTGFTKDKFFLFILDSLETTHLRSIGSGHALTQNNSRALNRYGASDSLGRTKLVTHF